MVQPRRLLATHSGKIAVPESSRGELQRPPFLGATRLNQVLQCLRKHGQRLDSEIAKELDRPLPTVRRRVAELVAAGAVVTCAVRRFEDGKKTEDALVCRLSGYSPRAAPGRKVKGAISFGDGINQH